MADSKRVTLATIAAETGVSVTTISKVLNGRGDVAASTRARVEAHLQRRGYARRGASSSDFVEVVLHELDTNWSLEVIEGVREVAAESGLTVSLSVSGDRLAPAAEWLTDVLRRRPAGVVLVFAGLPPAGRRKLKARGIPFVILDPAGDPAPGIPAIGSANWQGGLLATRHLTELGHRAIAAITGPEDMMAALARIDGYRSAMKAANLPVHPELGAIRGLPRGERRAPRRRTPRAGRTAHGDLRGQRPAGAGRAPRRRAPRARRAARPVGGRATTTSRLLG